MNSLIFAVPEPSSAEGGSHHKEQEQRVQEDVLGQDQCACLCVGAGGGGRGEGRVRDEG